MSLRPWEVWEPQGALLQGLQRSPSSAGLGSGSQPARPSPPPGAFFCLAVRRAVPPRVRLSVFLLLPAPKPRPPFIPEASALSCARVPARRAAAMLMRTGWEAGAGGRGRPQGETGSEAGGSAVGAGAGQCAPGPGEASAHGGPSFALRTRGGPLAGSGKAPWAHGSRPAAAPRARSPGSGCEGYRPAVPLVLRSRPGEGGSLWRPPTPGPTRRRCARGSSAPRAGGV